MVEKQTEIDGICELIIRNRDSIHIKCPESGLLSLSKAEHSGLKAATIRVKESFNLSDADHISETYTLIGIQEGYAIFEAELIFTGIGIPEEDWIKKKEVSLRPYTSQQ